MRSGSGALSTRGTNLAKIGAFYVTVKLNSTKNGLFYVTVKLKLNKNGCSLYVTVKLKLNKNGCSPRDSET